MTTFETPDAAQIYLDYRDKVTRYVRSRVNNAHDAEDLVSAVFVKVYAKLPDYDSSRASLSTWIYVITQRTVVDWLRRARPTLELMDNLSSAQDEVEAQFLRSDSLSALAAALRALPERERDTVILHYYHGWKLKEIADRMGLSYTTVKAAHSSALAQLRRNLDGVHQLISSQDSKEL